LTPVLTPASILSNPDGDPLTYDYRFNFSADLPSDKNGTVGDVTCLFTSSFPVRVARGAWRVVLA
jgi:hypothetical protein